MLMVPNCHIILADQGPATAGSPESSQALASSTEATAEATPSKLVSTDGTENEEAELLRYEWLGVHLASIDGVHSDAACSMHITGDLGAINHGSCMEG